MPLPSHRAKSFSAHKVFTDRTDMLELFRAKLEAPQAVDEYRVLVIYGVGGQGKTRLCMELERVVEDRAARAKDIAWGHLDFENPRARQPEEAVLRLRLALGSRGGIAFPAFNRAFMRHFSLVRPGASVQQHHPELFGSAIPDVGDLADLLQSLGGVPLLGEGVKGIKLGVKAFDHVRDWLQSRGRPLVGEIDGRSVQELGETLPKYLGADIEYYLTNAKTPKRLVVFIDTYERLWTGQPHATGAAALRVDGWFQQLAAEMPGVLFVVFGRDRIRWEETDPSWSGFLDQHLLDRLSNEDADRFLSGIPITEPEIRQRIVKSAKGTPFYLDLEANVYETMRNRNKGDALDPSVFGGSHPQIIARFLDHCDPAMVATLSALAHARFFDEAVFDALRKACPGQVYQVIFGDVAGQSFVIRQSDGTCVMHALMRDYLVERTARDDAQLATTFHDALSKYWGPRAHVSRARDVSSDTSRALSEAAYHLENVDPTRFANWLDEHFDVYWRAMALHALQPLLERQLQLRRQTFGNNHPDTARSHDQLGEVLRKDGKYGEAEREYRKAIDIRERALGFEHADTATSLENLGQLLGDVSRPQEAEVVRRKALGIRERQFGRDNLITVESLNSLAGCLRRLDRFAEAEDLFREVLSIRERLLESTHPALAWTLNDLALTLMNQDKFEEAELLYRRALVIYDTEYGPNHLASVPTLNNLAYLHGRLRDTTIAEKYFQLALSIRREKLGSHHPSTALSLCNLGRFLGKQGRYDVAEALIRQSLEIRISVFGPEHPSTATSQVNLALLFRDRGLYELADEHYQEGLRVERKTLGLNALATIDTMEGVAKLRELQERYIEAEQLLRQVVEIRVQRLGSEHPDTATAYESLADVLLKRGETQEAGSLFQRAMTSYASRQDVDQVAIQRVQQKLGLHG